MLDRDIRQFLYQNTLHHYTEDTNSRVIDEMGLSAHAARIDIGVINGQLVGYEIKSDRDNLLRLPRQLEIYNQIFDLITVVCGPKHEAKLLAYLPTHCGLLVTQKHGADSPSLRTVRNATQNEGRNGYMVASLLWCDEAKELLIRLGDKKGLSKLRKWELWERLACFYTDDIDALSEQVRGILKNRQTWREA
ncbi:sce7726 family protein [Hymenobacter sp. IS2118]|uniref:sce7726 family protein n=1 Tax=Hymenobacter sp. IS2118 TaxID=1505605 RepID=UPI001268DC13|nr:sce7726 family protein [Hymenobacter sp. IS2118]